jgi:predicted metal-dependent hydrolase
MKAGQQAFNRREFYEAHEFWEEVWDVTDDPDRTWIQGMIQVATGMHKLVAGRPDVARTLLEKAVGKLAGVTALDGLAVGALARDAAQLLAALRARKKVDPAEFMTLRTCDTNAP